MNIKRGRALVVGAGISGIRAALDLAESGYRVTLIDRKASSGGVLNKLDYQFPSNSCGMCKMLPTLDRDKSSQFCLRKGLFHDNIDLLFSTNLISVDGDAGKFEVCLEEKENFIDPEKCTGCAACVPVCPVEVPDDFNEGLTKRKAVYRQVPHAIPTPYLIDMDACIKCGECEKVCPVDAISLKDKERKNFNILVVDDELIVRDSLKEWLEDEGFSVDMAGSGMEAIEKLKQGSFKLMLLDIKMPEMDGVEVLKKALEMFPDLPVVMMTAYATVETAVEAMKTGALEYVMKPFDPDVFIPIVESVYNRVKQKKNKKIEVQAILVCCGTDYYNPESGKNTYGWNTLPNVLTSIEFERVLSGCGPSKGVPVRPSDQKVLKKVAWFQCVGSRDIQEKSDFCSSICCMYAIKEAVIAGQKSHGLMERTIFYMDMRTFGKSYEEVRQVAQNSEGVEFKRAIVHSVVAGNDSGDLIVNYVDYTGAKKSQTFDMIVLSVGQRPAKGSDALCKLLDMELNQWSFPETQPFSLSKSSRSGIFLGGSFSGLKDIGESVICSSAAALDASKIIHSAGGSIAEELPPNVPGRDVSKELPRVLVLFCRCGKDIAQEALGSKITENPHVERVVFFDQTCTSEGWESILTEFADDPKFNRVLLAACNPYVFRKKIKELSKITGLDPAFISIVDILKCHGLYSDQGIKTFEDDILITISMGISALVHARDFEACNPEICKIDVEQRALVVGGGIAGMVSALGIADLGYGVDLVEKRDNLGGNTQWIHDTIDGLSVDDLLCEYHKKISSHPLITVHMETKVTDSYGDVGNFYSVLQAADSGTQTLRHGVTIIATGAQEAETGSYAYADSEKIITQKEFGINYKSDESLKDIKSVVMIQCVDSRDDVKKYCSRVCCSTTLKYALRLKKLDPMIDVYVFYRDMMSYGFLETYYTKARNAGVIFIQFNPDQKPEVVPDETCVRVMAREMILDRDISIDADLVILATGIKPTLDKSFAERIGIEPDSFGFFKEAESKWRPVDSIKEGVFSCGICLSPGNIGESIASAKASASQALKILNRKTVPAGRTTAIVRETLCSLCMRCIETCPYDARMLDMDMKKIIVNPAKCQGCGSCSAVCPNSASVVTGFEDQKMFSIIDAALN